MTHIYVPFEQYIYRKEYFMRRLIAVTIACVLAVVGILFVVVFRYRKQMDQVLNLSETEKQTEIMPQTETEPLTEAAQTEQALTEAETEPLQTEDPALHMEDGIYTFLQGPVAWESKAPWSGIWCESELDGGTFSVFGCGLCDMASVYSSLTPYECSPLDMYALARKVSGYAPSDGAGAIDWPYMQETLEKTGFSITLKTKNKKYSAFQKAIEGSLGAIVLISSNSDDTYWQDTPGHYVNIWHYNPETDKVFLGDSGNPKHNRQWIPLKYIYDALSEENAWQYMLVTAYDESKNTWKYSGIHEKWTRPSYYKAKPESRSLLMPPSDDE